MQSTPLRLVVTGHVDHGKSTVTGRLLADTHALPDGKLEAIRDYCERNAKPFEYAFLLDALKDERAQGITIDAARIFFSTKKRRYVLLDTPGHIEFLRNMVTGAAQADAAVLVIDAQEGVRENSRRHGYLLSFLGIRQIAVVINKMDLVGWDAVIYDGIVSDYTRFLEKLGLVATGYIPASAMQGDNISRRSAMMPWYGGPTLLEMLDRFTVRGSSCEGVFRMPVQDVYRFSRDNDLRRIVAGTVLSGRIAPRDEIVFYPSNKRSVVESLETFPVTAVEQYTAGEAAGFTMTEQIYITRGELAAKAGERPPEVSDRFRAKLFWLGKEPLTPGKDYLIKLGATKCIMRIERIIRTMDASTLDERSDGDAVARNEAAECEIRTIHPLAFDTADGYETTARFVIVDDFDIRGGGIILESLDGTPHDPYHRIMTRNYHWASGRIDRDLRAERHGHRPHLVIITGAKDTGKKALARELEALLFAEGRLAFFMGIANLLYGVDADIKGLPGTREEHLRRLSELANILLEAGHILIVTAIELTDEDRTLIERSIPREQTFVVWVGAGEPTATDIDIRFPSSSDRHEAAVNIRTALMKKGVILTPPVP